MTESFLGKRGIFPAWIAHSIFYIGRRRIAPSCVPPITRELVQRSPYRGLLPQTRCSGQRSRANQLQACVAKPLHRLALPPLGFEQGVDSGQRRPTRNSGFKAIRNFRRRESPSLLDANRFKRRRRLRGDRILELSISHARKQKKSGSKREVIEPQAGDKRYVRRKADGTFGKTVDAEKSLSSHRRRTAKKTVPQG